MCPNGVPPPVPMLEPKQIIGNPWVLCPVVVPTTHAPPADTGGSSLCPGGGSSLGSALGPGGGERRQPKRCCWREKQVEERAEGTREGKKMWKKSRKGPAGPPWSLLRFRNEAGDSGWSAWTPFSCGSAPLPATCGCICCSNKPSLPAPGVVCFPRASPAAGWVEEGETQPLGTQAGTRGSRGCRQRLC